MPRGAALRYVTRGCPPARAAHPPFPAGQRRRGLRAPGAGRPRYVRRCGRLPERRSVARTGGCVSADVRGARCGVCGQRGSGSARSVPARCFAAPAGAGRNAGFRGAGALRAAVPASLPAAPLRGVGKRDGTRGSRPRSAVRLLQNRAERLPARRVLQSRVWDPAGRCCVRGFGKQSGNPWPLLTAGCSTCR